MSPSKEPHYFSKKYQLTCNIYEYESLFENAKKHHKWRLEASVWYLFSEDAVTNILAYNSDAKFIAMVRKPIQIIPSMHRQQLYNANEYTEDIEKALDLNDARVEGAPVGMRRGYPARHLAYLSSCALGWQIDRLAKILPACRYRVILYDDLESDPKQSYLDILEFLNIPQFVPSHFERINEAKKRRSMWLDRMVKNIGEWKARNGPSTRFGILSGLRRLNRKTVRPSPLKFHFRKKIAEHMSDDVRLLGSLLDRDLDHWLAVEETHSSRAA